MGRGTPEPSGTAVVRLRLKAGLSARQLAGLAGVSYSSVCRVERGRAATKDVLVALARVLGPSVYDSVPPWPPEPKGSIPVLRARREWGVSRLQAAKRIGVTDDVLARAERGEGVRPMNARLIASAYGLDVEDVTPVSPTKARPRHAA